MILKLCSSLKKFLQISKTSLTNPLGETSQEKFNTLLMRIHNFCVYSLFGIKLRRQNHPSSKKKSWKSKLKHYEIEALNDPTLNLKQIKTPRNDDYYRPTSSKEMNLTTIPFNQSLNDKVIAELQYPKEADLSIDKKNASTISLSIPTTNSKKQILETQFSSSPSTSKKKDSSTRNLQTKNKEQHSSWSNIHTKNKEQHPSWSNHINRKKYISCASVTTSHSSSKIKNIGNQKKHTPTSNSNVISKCTLDKKSNKPYSSSKETKASAKDSATVSEWKRNYDLMRSFCPVIFGRDELPKSWTSAKGGMHPKQCVKAKLLEMCKICLLELDDLVDDDLKEQLDQAEAESDHDEIYAIQSQIDGEMSMEDKCTIDIKEPELHRFMKRVLKDNIFWYICFQMNHLPEHGKNDLYKNDICLARKCYCPCSNIMIKWGEHFHIDDVV
jgi:hypothetical protein